MAQPVVNFVSVHPGGQCRVGTGPHPDTRVWVEEILGRRRSRGGQHPPYFTDGTSTTLRLPVPPLTTRPHLRVSHRDGPGRGIEGGAPRCDDKSLRFIF